MAGAMALAKGAGAWLVSGGVTAEAEAPGQAQGGWGFGGWWCGAGRGPLGPLAGRVDMACVAEAMALAMVRV